MKTKKYLSADRLFKMVKKGFQEIKEHRASHVEIPLEDVLMSGFAMFSLKDPSLLAFDKRREAPENLKRIYGLKCIPSDTSIRLLPFS